MENPAGISNRPSRLNPSSHDLDGTCASIPNGLANGWRAFARSGKPNSSYQLIQSARWFRDTNRSRLRCFLSLAESSLNEPRLQ